MKKQILAMLGVFAIGGAAGAGATATLQEPETITETITETKEVEVESASSRSMKANCGKAVEYVVDLLEVVQEQAQASSSGFTAAAGFDVYGLERAVGLMESVNLKMERLNSDSNLNAIAQCGIAAGADLG